MGNWTEGLPRQMDRNSTGAAPKAMDVNLWNGVYPTDKIMII